MNTYRYCRRMNIRHHTSFTAADEHQHRETSSKEFCTLLVALLRCGLSSSVMFYTRQPYSHTDTHTRTYVPWAVGTRTVNDVHVCVLCSVLCILIAIRVYRRASIRRRLICTITDQHSHNNNSSTAHGAHTHITTLGSFEFFSFFVFFVVWIAVKQRDRLL